MPLKRQNQDLEQFSLSDAESVRADNQHIDEILTYFEARTGGSRLPRRQDVVPAKLTKYLPEICFLAPIYDTSETFDDMVVQLMGTTVANFYGEITGQTIMEGAPSREVADRILNSCRRVVETRRAVVAEAAALSQEKDHLRVRVLYVPLSEDGVRIDRIFGHVRVNLRSVSEQGR